MEEEEDTQSAMWEEDNSDALNGNMGESENTEAESTEYIAPEEPEPCEQ